MKRVRALIGNKKVRAVAAVLIINITLVGFACYLAINPDVFNSVLSLSPLSVFLLTIFYLLTIIANGFVLWASLRLIGSPVRFFENIALTGYSSIVNFFGPLQSGPGFRAAYLKARHGVKLKRFLYVTLIFYGFFAFINSLVILSALLYNLPTIVLALVPAVLGLIGIAVRLAWLRIPQLRSTAKSIKVTNVNFWYIGVGALLLSIATSLAYFVELRHVDQSVTFLQTIIYTAAANLALFVSLTPGAIGFRESFLLLSQQLHGISSNVVIAASIIDRAFYVVFLLVLFLALLGLGVRRRLRNGSLNSDR